MVKPQKRTIGAITILLMLGVSPLSVTYSFADIGNSQEDKTEKSNSNTVKSTQKERLGAILTEKVVNGKLELLHYALPDDISEKDMQRMLFSEDQTSGWAYVNYEIYHSGIVLFDGKASKVGENLWKISSNDMLNLEESEVGTDFIGKTNDTHIGIHENISEEDLNYRVIFSGKVIETDEKNVFVISILNSGFKSPEMGQNIKFLSIGELAINSEKSIGSNQEFRNSILVK